MDDIARGPFAPEDIPSLSLERLAANGEYLAVSSVAMFGAGQDQGSVMVALNALAANAEDPDAFHWWWRTLTKAQRKTDGWLSSSTRLSKRVAVPAELQEEVAATLVAQRPPQQRQVTVRDQFREELFGRLGPGSDLARRVATEVVASPSTPRMAEIAYAVLGASKEPDDRTQVIAGASAKSPPDLKRLLYLEPPLLEDEIEAVRDAVRTHLRNLQDAHRDAAANLLALLPLDDVCALLLAFPSAASKLVTGGFVTRLGPDSLRELLVALDDQNEEPSAGSADTVITSLLAVINNLGDNAHPFALWATEKFGVNHIAGYRQQLLNRAGSSIGRNESGAAARRQLVELLAVEPDDALVDELALVVQPLEVTGAGLADLSVVARRALGRALGKAVTSGKRLTLDAVVTVLVDATDEQPLEDVAPVVGGFISTTASPPTELVTLLADPAGVPEAVAAGAAQPVASALGGAQPPLSTRVAAVGAAIEGDDADVQAFLDLVEPAELTAGAVRDLADSLTGRSALLGAFSQRLLLSLTGPEARAVPTGPLGSLLSETVASGAFDEVVVTGQIAAAAASAAHAPGRAIQYPLAEWLSRAPLSREALDVAIAADEGHTDAANPFAEARRTLARRYADQARAGSRETEQRVRDLSLAARAESTTAREAALTLLRTPNPELRRPAAELLATSDGRSDEVPLLEKLLAEETDRTTRDNLVRALRRIKSGDVGEALHNLLELLGLADEAPKPDILVYLPYEQWHETFISCVDETRSAVTTNPSGVVQASLRLGEFLIDQVVATQWLSSGDERSEKQGQLLLENAVGKQPIGTLLKRQDLLEKFPWMHSYAALREDRSVHPAPRGRTTPASAEAVGSLGLGLTTSVVRGWLEAMAYVR